MRCVIMMRTRETLRPRAPRFGRVVCMLEPWPLQQVVGRAGTV